MSTTGLRQFDDTIHTTNIWLKDILENLRWSERSHAYKALKAMLHAVRDRLPVSLSAHLSAQLPMLVRGIYFESWQPAAEAQPDRSLASFLQPIDRAFERYPGIRSEIVCAAVFDVMGRHISRGEMENVIQALPKPVREIANAPFHAPAIAGL